MKFHKRTDKNQKSIVEALRKIGCSVYVLSDSGKGLPDLLIGVDNLTIIIECKTKDNWYGKKGLSKSQSEFVTNWKGGLILVVYDAEDAVNQVDQQRQLIRNFNKMIESDMNKAKIKQHILNKGEK